MILTVKQINDFYTAHPECIGKLKAKTRYGYKTIQYADITAYDSPVITLKTETNKNISCSPDHLLNDGMNWIKVKDIKVTTNLLTEDGLEKVTSCILENYTEDLYDLQIEDVKEFYANKFVSHNSTILDCLCFVLFNKPFRNINKGQLLNTITGKNGLVEIEFQTNNIKYKIRRGIKPNIFEIYRDEILINQSADVRDYQEILEKNILKMKYKTFCQVVILGSANYTPFMTLKAADRRSFIEDLLDIQIFSTMNILLKEKISVNKTQIIEIESDIKHIQSSLDLIKKHEEDLRKNTDDLVKQKQDQIFESLDKIEDINQEIKGIEHDVEGHKIVSERWRGSISKLEEANLVQTKLDTKIKKYQKEIQFYCDSDVCSTCQQEISQDFRSTRISTAEKTKQTALSNRDKLSAIITQLKEETQNYQKSITEISNKNHQIQTLNTKISGIQTYIQSLQSDITKLQKTTDTKITNNKQDYIDKLSHTVSKKDDLLREREIYTISSIFLKDGGIKAQIIKQYIPIMNQWINKYLTDMEFFCQFTMNEEFEEDIKSMYKDEFSFESFSEGEKMRLNLAILFTWRELARLRNSASTNLLILDEVMDSSLDSYGTDEFIKIIHQLAGHNNIFIISHKTDQILEKFNKIIHFEKTKNFSKVVQ